MCPHWQALGVGQQQAIWHYPVNIGQLGCSDVSVLQRHMCVLRSLGMARCIVCDSDVLAQRLHRKERRAGVTDYAVFNLTT